MLVIKKNKLNEELLISFRKYLVSGKTKRILLTVMGLTLGSGVILLLIKQMLLGVAFISFGIITFFIYFSIGNRVINLNLNRMEEVNGVREISMDLIFGEDGISIVNLNNSGVTTLNYNSFTTLVENDILYGLITTSEQFIIIEKGLLNELEREQFNAIIKEKCANIKLIRE